MTALAELLARKRLLIFDLDGTLVDSSPLHARAYREAFAPHGIAVDYATITGMTTEEAADKLLGEGGVALSAAQRETLIVDKRRRALALIEAELEAMAGAVEFVAEARPLFALALCTSASRPSVAMALARTGLEGRFDAIVTAEDVRRGKPDPEGFLKAAAACGAAPGDSLVFEDAPSGLAAAAAAGIDAIRIAAPPAGDGGMDWATLRAALAELRR